MPFNNFSSQKIFNTTIYGIILSNKVEKRIYTRFYRIDYPIKSKYRIITVNVINLILSSMMILVEIFVNL